jgi:hypothetical protein
MVHIIHRFTIA